MTHASALALGALMILAASGAAASKPSRAASKSKRTTGAPVVSAF